MHRYLSGSTKVILQLKHIGMVNGHWLYPSLILYAEQIAQSYSPGPSVINV